MFVRSTGKRILAHALELMKIPDGLEAYVDAEVEKALESASRRNGGLTRGKSLVEIARAYVEVAGQ